MSVTLRSRVSVVGGSASRHVRYAVDSYFISKVTDNTSKCEALSGFTPIRRTDKKMKSSYSYAAAAKWEHDLSEQLSVMDDHRIPEGYQQSVSDPPTYCIRAAGVLRYNRESDNHRINLNILPAPQPLTEYPVKCEYCGENTKPSLDLTWVHAPERAPSFCCAGWQQLCMILVKQRCLVDGRCDLRIGTPTSPGDKPATKMEEHLFQGREMEDHNKFIMDLPSGLGKQSELIIYEDYSIQLPVTETFAPTSKVLRFRLSCAPGKGCWTVYPFSATEKHLKIKEEEEPSVLVPSCNHKPLQFGICHQDGARCLQKYYSNGMKFLTVFPDGSAQAFYPSGLLALVVVSEENGRVCIVYDDSDASYQPIRAMFQSDGRATCYHSNGNIWLTLNRSGGQCLDEEGARVRRWSWSSPCLTPTPLHPVFLSLNKSVGVRVLAKEQVFVSFLARGQQAKFSMGACCAQGDCKTEGAASGPSALKEELVLLVARIKIRLAIQHLHQYLKIPSHPQMPSPPPPCCCPKAPGSQC
ncbi:glutamate-rich protein 6-like isoform X1 [Micropterus salmoides]|uniref:glutamate-rich protein 6-like isoform X1 n=2 Tax=Micropterus salmoides TaxID=27706 RepID=UPI0018EAD505|nr:glutamate-rich protein 6-like isoform X1 [Micropterus salmoides]